MQEHCTRAGWLVCTTLRSAAILLSLLRLCAGVLFLKIWKQKCDHSNMSLIAKHKHVLQFFIHCFEIWLWFWLKHVESNLLLFSMTLLISLLLKMFQVSGNKLIPLVNVTCYDVKHIVDQCLLVRFFNFQSQVTTCRFTDFFLRHPKVRLSIVLLVH